MFDELTIRNPFKILSCVVTQCQRAFSMSAVSANETGMTSKYFYLGISVFGTISGASLAAGPCLGFQGLLARACVGYLQT